MLGAGRNQKHLPMNFQIVMAEETTLGLLTHEPSNNLWENYTLSYI